MRTTDFVVGKTYTIVTKDWQAPVGGTVPGKAMTIEVLPAQGLGEALAFDGGDRCLASPLEVQARKDFLRVRRETGRVHLLHPETIVCATEVR